MAALTQGAASITATFAVAGTHQITANYGGDSTHPAISASGSLTVFRNSAQVTLAASASSTSFGQPVTFTARLQTPSGIAAPTGTVQYFWGTSTNPLGTLLGTAAVANGAASLTVTSLPAGSGLVIASYGGDATWEPAESLAVTQTVAKAKTATAWVSAATGAQRLVFSVKVGGTAPTVPTGTVQILDGTAGMVLGSATLVGGTATVGIVPTAAPGPLFTASYTGDANFEPSATAALALIAVAEAAGYSTTTVSAAELVAIFGLDLADKTLSAGLPLPTTLSGVGVQVTDSAGTTRPAVLLIVSPTQINAMIPLDTATGAATVTVTASSGILLSRAVSITPTAPGLFAANGQGKGVAAAQTIRPLSDGTQEIENVFGPDGQAVPIDLSSGTVYLSLYGTGIRHQSSATCTIGGIDAAVLYAGPQPSFAGLDQVNVSVPAALTGAGSVEVKLTVDGRTANTVTVMFR